MRNERKLLEFNQTEKKGIVVFCVIIFLLIIAYNFTDRFARNSTYIDQDKLTNWLAHANEDSVTEFINIKEDREKYSPKLNAPLRFRFNPNSITKDSLQLLGFNNYQIKNLLAYRAAGGVFNHPVDLYKIYGVDSITSSELLPYIQLPEPKVPDYTPTSLTTTTIVIEINKATKEELMRFSGVGDKRSDIILKYRNLLGGFADVSQFDELYGFNDSILISIKKQVVIDTLAVRALNINKATFKELLRHPYLNKYQVNSIVQYRELHGDFKSTEKLFQNPYLNLSLNPLLVHYLTVD